MFRLGKEVVGLGSRRSTSQLPNSSKLVLPSGRKLSIFYKKMTELYRLGLALNFLGNSQLLYTYSDFTNDVPFYESRAKRGAVQPSTQILSRVKHRAI